MKVFIILASFVGLAVASPLYATAPLAAVATGTSSQYRSEDNFGNYAFGYDESHATGGSSRREEETGGVRRGSYSLHDADGRRRLVNYVADATGFHASVDTNEPGVEPKDSANVAVNKAATIVAAAPVAVAAAPAPVAQVTVAAAAPIQTYAAAAPVAVAAAPLVVEAPAPRAFSYAFGATHAAPVAQVAVATAAAAPIYQQRIVY